ncbi:hypothetical protein GGI04_002884 [Coemansia thaxteri]|uniref:Transmembrane protein n=1 Tax=Coemansia thaxteri TaxID=2663907 RepID=A0A9W8EL25_9FUNG|nr:hypothetical protein GGI04_002884 [Coemansia thaxteri]KAJ2006168.1 hypothetical protein H4R26_001542 [Coemansia thaxteri]KAJ2485721.1 hypothetical protein EV174_001547 [Coemansia sp. RSA 2320]
MPFDFADRDARRRVLWGTVGLGATGAAVGLNIAILRNLQPIRRHALTMAANWSLYGLFFLATREALLSEQRQKSRSLQLRPSLSTRERDEMFSSVVAGGLTGGILAFITRGRRAAVFSGVGFFALLSAAGQYTYTALNRRRRELILRELAGPLAKPDESASGPLASVWTRLRQALMVDPISRLPSWFPLRRLPSSEYRAMLELRREEARLELARMRSAIAAMDSREQTLLSLFAAPAAQ